MLTIAGGSKTAAMRRTGTTQPRAGQSVRQRTRTPVWAVAGWQTMMSMDTQSTRSPALTATVAVALPALGAWTTPSGVASPALARVRAPAISKRNTKKPKIKTKQNAFSLKLKSVFGLTLLLKWTLLLAKPNNMVM